MCHVPEWKTALWSALAAVLWLTPVAGQEAGAPPDLQQRAEKLLEETLTASDPELALARARASSRLFASAGDAHGEGMSLLMVGSIEAYQGQADAAQVSFRRASELLESTGDGFGAWFVRLAEAEGWRSVGNWEAATAGFQRSLEALQELAESDAEISLESFRYFAPSQMPRQLLDQIEPMLALMKPMLVQFFRASTLVEMAATKREQGRHDEASRILDQALALAQPHFKPLIGQILVEKAELELARERPTRALALYEAALPQAREAVDLGRQARILRGIAEIHALQGREAQATEYLEQADALAPAGQESPACWLPKTMIDLPQ